MIRQIFFIFISLLLILPLPSVVASPVLLAELTLPSPPTPPSPPSVKKLKDNQPKSDIPATKKSATEQNKEQEQPTVNKQQSTDAPPPLPKNTTTITTPPNKKPRESADTSKAQPEKAPVAAQIQHNFIPDTPESDIKEKQPVQAQETWEDKWLTPSTKNTIYTILAIILSAGILYFYQTTPTESITKPKKTSTRIPTSKKPSIHTPKESPPKTPQRSTPEPPPLFMESKIKNTSLLEQLIKYDMENYGELRSNLDYEQPAYVERLIRKYGGNDKNKINRAINLFYIGRDNK